MFLGVKERSFRPQKVLSGISQGTQLVEGLMYCSYFRLAVAEPRKFPKT